MLATLVSSTLSLAMACTMLRETKDGSGAGARAGSTSGVEGWTAEESRYSRQLLAFGRKAQARIRLGRVLVHGLDATGAEVCKNLALAGVASIDVSDGSGPDTCAAVASEVHLYAGRAEETRAARTLAGAAALNPLCTVGLAPGGTAAAAATIRLGTYDCVAYCGGDEVRARRLNEACRDSSVPFVWARSAGGSFSVFNDFGDGFRIAVREILGGAAEPTPLEPLFEHTPGVYLVRTVSDAERHEACEGDELHLARTGSAQCVSTSQGPGAPADERPGIS
mmetsp:Transcript_3415/g.10021  ORF Transcript_3415/g.10021 Transcript_3415/m.10021 type:complete len:280 (-) Transcript_3415:770-1609(-)